MKHSARASRHTPLRGGGTWLFLIAGALTGLAITLFFSQGHRYDFTSFYTDGVAWNTGAPLYSRANLNPPSATLAVFGPLARLPFRHAQAVWTCVGLIGLLASLRIIAGELGWTRKQAVTGAALLLTSHAAFLVFAFGQVTWALLWPATLAWSAFRRDRLQVAGAWFGLLVAVKPTFAITALVLPWPVWLTAGGVSLSVSALAVAVTGWSAWLQWAQVGQSVSWIEDPLSASFWGVLARFEHVSRLADLSGGSVLLGLAVGCWAIWRTLAVTEPDRRLVCAWLLQATIGPLGWIYYLPLAFGPAVASWRGGPFASATVWLLCIPLGLIEPKPFPMLMGLIYPLALFCAWTAWTARPAQQLPLAITYSD